MAKTLKDRLEAMLDDAAPQITEALIDKARIGDTASLKMVIDRLLPTRERALSLELPEIKSAADIPAVIGFVIGAVSRGEIVPSEASVLVGLLNNLRSAHETVELQARLEALEQKLGDVL